MSGACSVWVAYGRLMPAAFDGPIGTGPFGHYARLGMLPEEAYRAAGPIRAHMGALE